MGQTRVGPRTARSIKNVPRKKQSSRMSLA
jgi:hypothetical protein